MINCTLIIYNQVVAICTTTFNVNKFCVLRTEWIYVFCMDPTVYSEYVPIQHEFVGFYNGDGVFLLRGAS
jgi:hypothetical protein